MAMTQEIAKYGRLSGVGLGPVDVVRFAEAFGAKGLRIEKLDQISSTIQKLSRCKVLCSSRCPWTTEITTGLWR
jgi:thiamine pyrophosphate-dependent acetolactate synthase large subunit-like protein